MKFEDFLMQPSEDKQKIKDLKEEVEKLQEELDGELQLKTVLQCALRGPMHSCPCLISFPLPRKVQMLLAELTMVEEEIIRLEREVDELKLNLYQEQKQTKEWKKLSKNLQTQRGPCHNKSLCSKEKTRTDYGLHRKYRTLRQRTTSVGSSIDIQSLSFPESNDFRGEVARNSSFSRSCLNYIQLDIEEFDNEKPNKLSEETVKCLIGIFLELNQAAYEIKGSANVPKHTRSCINSKGFISKTSFSCTSPPFSWDHSESNFDPYGILQDLDGTIKDVGAYKNFLQITRGSVNKIHVSECHPAMQKLRILMHKISNVGLTYLTNKQKLAFWINMYNACIMHAFLQHGFPTAQDKLLPIMNEAAMNVGGIVLNSLAIEHFILRHPSESKPGLTDGKEMLLRRTYGLGYPEPNVTFALCRGSWSSPALRIYTADQVVNELERAKVEYLEASIGVTSKKKILVPKLMHWHMKDFADDMESLLEWIYSQLQQSGSLKRLIMECLKGDRKSPVAKMVEIQPYSSEFRYILSL